MKTELDDYDELVLERLAEEDYLTCWVRPLSAAPRDEKGASPEGELYRIEFHDPREYLVLQEVTNAALGIDYEDDGLLTEVVSSRLLEFFFQRELSPNEDIRHFALRTAHCVVHVFTTENPYIFLETADEGYRPGWLPQNI